MPPEGQRNKHLVVDGDFDILLMTETRLYASGDKAYITEMTPSGYLFHSFPRIGHRGGGIAIMFKSALSASSAVQLIWVGGTVVISWQHISLSDLFISPPSQQAKQTVKQNILWRIPNTGFWIQHACRELAFIGDFNFHFEDSSSGDVDQLKTLPNDHHLVHLVDMPTHKQGHALDWVTVRHDTSRLSLKTGEDTALSDHSAIYSSVNVERPTARKRLVTSRNLRTMNSADFQADIKSFAETAGDQCADLGFVDVYDTGLRQVLDCHAPLTTRRVSDSPSAPWMTDGIKAAKCQLRRAERQWRAIRLTVHRDLHQASTSFRLWWEQQGNFTSVPGLRTVQTPSSSFQCPTGFLASQRPHHSHLTYHILHSRTDFACFSLKNSWTSDKTLMLILRNQQHSLPMIVLNSDFSSLSQKRRFVNSLLNRLPKPAC